MLRWPLMLRITVAKQNEMPRSHAFDKREITVGRTPVNDVVIPEPGVSSSHARILFTGSEITLIDLESTNGTFVNGSRIQGPYILAPRDEVFICAHRIEFEVAGASQSAAPHSNNRPEPSYPHAAPGPSFGEPPMMPSPVGASMTPMAPPPMMPPPGLAVPPAGVPSSVAPPPMAPPPMMPPPFAGPPSFGNEGGYAPPSPIGQLGVPSAVGVGGPMPRAAEHSPTMPPPLALDPLPVAEVSPPELPPELAAPPPLEAPPARTGSTFTPAGAGLPESVPPEAPPAAPTREPPASLEPVGLAPEVVPRWDSVALATPSMPPVVAQSQPPAPSVPPPVSEPSLPPPLALEPTADAIVPTPAPAPEPEAAIATGAYGNDVPVAPQQRQRSAAVRSDDHAPAFARSSPSRPPGVPTVIPASPPPIMRSNPSASPVFIDPRHLETVEVEFEDLSSLSGAALARSACARVFAAVHDMLVGESGVPERDAETRARARAEALRMLQQASESVAGIEARPWAERIASEMCGLGALSARLAEPDVQEIFVHGPDRVLVRRANGVPTEIDARFSCPQAIEVVVRRLTATNFGAENPIVDARTLDGADVYAVHESVAHGGPVVNISLPSPSEPRWSLELLMSDGSISPVLANLFTTCVQAGLGILVCAGPGARSFPLVAALLECAPTTDRHVLVRPMSEMGVLPSHLVVLEGDGLVGTDGTTVMQALVRTAVGLRPDRLCVHEASGPEVVEVLAAAGRGLSGTLLSTRAGSAEAGIHRLAALAALAGGGSSDAQARAHVVARSLELVVCVARFPDGRTRVVEVAESAVSPDGRTFTVEIIGIDPRTGSLRHTGAVPSFFATLQRRGIVVDAAMLSG